MADIRWLFERLQRGEPIRINCGGNEYRDGDAREWGRDRFFEGGNLRPNPAKVADLDVAGTDDDPLHRSNRLFNRGRGGYRIPLPVGRYRVTLHNSETYFQEGREQRVYDVLLEGETVLESHEPLAHGWATAYEEQFDVEVSDGLLDLEFIPRIENPKICAIEIQRVE